ncbi:tryptophan 2,3-dioxygenase [Saccharothrix algeriensis]|uniref:Tryptophan 2,3-dioxygenase n=1 Tax=Saccharothrix algeriensis TaxID=173560 RepID=A0A8T8HYY5_9PSEU|nr:tryptophan 2,3-dioxygenase family protein [Saccharothrix algeriensis]MBM7809271.1 tryptophan 2,3-dioxygenase [Saccharothrix algeriensis]QTR03621.1 hypothetical protein J7S33_00735 [Saccharothrix algeriensis]
MKTVEAGPDDHPRTRAWLREYLSRDHEHLGRAGNVCPFVRPALAGEAIAVRTAHHDADTGLATLCRLMREELDRFDAMQWPEGKEPLAALVVVLPDLPAHHGVLLDEAQRRTKPCAVRRGMMIGQFHPRCAEPAVWNPVFPVSRSPEPLFAVRRMAFHDILFLHGNPGLFAEYRKRFGDRYDQPGAHVPEAFTRLHDLARHRGSGRGEYVDYQSVDVLLSLQQPHTDHPAELAFYLTGQVKELLFKLLHEQARAVRLDLAADRVDDAAWGLRRLAAALDVLTRVWDVPATLSPAEFAAFRDRLGGASGVDSYMYRMAEFALGRKSPALAARHLPVPGVAEDVYRALHDSSVHDEALALLARRGLLADGADSAAVAAAWAAVYRAAGPSDDLFRLAEALMDVAQGFSRWRALHLLVVERTIGAKPGTGGTSGVDWLRGAADHRFFPELWHARTLLPGGVGRP